MTRGRRFGRWMAFPVAVSVALGCAEQPRADAVEEPPSAQQPEQGGLLLAAASVALPPDGVTQADLPDPESAGAQAVVQYCQACHALSHPTSHSATDWPVVLRRMWLRTGMLAPEWDVPVPNTAERFAIAQYMIDNALQVQAADLPEGPGQELYVETCGKCHDLPDVRQHSPADWAAVVIRMSRRMERMLGAMPSQGDIQRIVGYLEQASGS